MIIPCIDLMDRKVVQLVQGKDKFLELPDPLAVLEKFSSYPQIQVIDLDAAMSKPQNNSPIVRELCRRKPCRVGGGIRDIARAQAVVADGALKAIVGSSAFTSEGIRHDFLAELAAAVSPEKILIAVDSFGGKVAVHGWKKTLPLSTADALPQLEKYCSGFLCTYIDGEGRLKGTDLEWFRSLRAVTKLPITAAGGITTDFEIEALEKMGMDAALGMSIYRKVFPEFFTGRQPDSL
jgi:phosphoribosylformimino-5-aminoimidazole carboxamide ribonucleotide (ProFAR) isomerase